jgi:hypothetical protein
MISETHVYGFNNEDRLSKYFFETYQATKTTYRYSLFDFESETVLIELKSRRCFHNSYFDTMIPLNKVEEGYRHLRNKTKEHVFFYFDFTDGLYFYELKENFILRRDSYNGRPYYFIPVEHLSRTEVPHLLKLPPCPVKHIRGI